MTPSSSTHPSAHAMPSSSPSQGSSSPDTHDESLIWTGRLSPEQLSTIRSEFGSLILNPGFMHGFGYRKDRQRRIRIPGANKSYWQTLRKLSRWREAAKHEKHSWWLAAMRENGIAPLTANDVLDGLDVERWMIYRRAYQIHRKAHARSQGGS